MTPHEYAELLDQCSKLFRSIVVSTAFPRPKSRQPIFLDGILHTASNALRNVGIHLAARKAGFSENAKLLLYEDRPVHQLYESLDIAKFRIGLTKPSMAERIKNRLIRISPWPFDKKKIFDERYKNIQLGNYALDTAIRYLPNAFTISQIPKRTALTLRSSARRIARRMQEIIDLENPSAIVLSHKYYNEFGVLGAVSVLNEVPVFSLNSGFIKRCDSFKDWERDDFTLTPEVKADLNARVDSEVAMAYAERRFKGLGLDMDSANGYASKRTLSREQLIHELGLDFNKPIAVIMPHAFSDANHCDSWMIHDTYFDWYHRVLNMTASMSHVHWIVRTHPSSHMYSETGVGASFALKYPHIKVLDDNVQTSSVFGFADAVLTVRGTAGLESLYFGIQPILAGAAWYDSLTGVVSCRTESQLKAALMNISKRVEKPEDDAALLARKLDAAKAIYFRFGSHDFTAPSVGRELNPGLTEQESIDHDGKQLINFLKAFRKPEDYWNDPYVIGFVKMFDRQLDLLSIVDLGDASTNTK